MKFFFVLFFLNTDLNNWEADLVKQLLICSGKRKNISFLCGQIFMFKVLQTLVMQKLPGVSPTVTPCGENEEHARCHEQITLYR